MTHPTQPHPSDQPNGGPGVYECRHATFRNRMWCWWNGTNLFLHRTPEGEGWNMVVTADYTDFLGPLTLQPEGWEEVVGWLSSICMWFEAELKGHIMGTPKTIDAWKMHSLLLEARAALAKLDTAKQEREGE